MRTCLLLVIFMITSATKSKKNSYLEAKTLLSMNKTKCNILKSTACQKWEMTFPLRSTNFWKGSIRSFHKNVFLISKPRNFNCWYQGCRRLTLKTWRETLITQVTIPLIKSSCGSGKLSLSILKRNWPSLCSLSRELPKFQSKGSRIWSEWTAFKGFPFTETRATISFPNHTHVSTSLTFPTIQPKTFSSKNYLYVWLGEVKALVSCDLV